MPGIDWDVHYRGGHPPWETGQPSSELRRVIEAENMRPCRVIELGCGSGINAVWLAQQGFDVTALDFNQLAIAKAHERSQAAGVSVRFMQADVLNFDEALEPYPFFFDRGCYHSVRGSDLRGYLSTLQKVTAAKAVGLILAGNAREPHEPGQGPPQVSEEEIKAELSTLFEIVRLREFRFDSTTGTPAWLGWSCLLQRRP